MYNILNFRRKVWELYKLTFESGDFYIGQTTNYHRRIQAHISQKGKGSPKLEKAFEDSKLVKHEVLIETDKMNTEEARLIQELNPSLNTMPGGENMRGLNSPRSKYSKEDIEEVVDLFLNSKATYKQIADITCVQQGTVHDILKRRSHQWATEGLEAQLEKARDSRTPIIAIYDPQGTAHEVSKPYAPEEARLGLGSGVISIIIRKGKRNGWSTTPPRVYRILDPELNEVVLTEYYARILFRDSGLSKYQIAKLLDGRPAGDWLADIIHIEVQKS